MFNLVLVEPEIPPNTGNVIRLCANMGAKLHLVEPLGFSLDEKALRRAGLDYHALTALTVWPTWDELFAAADIQQMYTVSTKHSVRYDNIAYRAGDWLIFGSETRGLSQAIRESVKAEHRVTLPMAADSRSLNLSNCVSIVAFEAWRQIGFAGAVIRE